MPDINWGGDSTTAPYSSRYDGSAGDLVLVEDNDGQTVLLEWDGSAFQHRGPVEMNGEDVTGVGALDAQSVSAGEQNSTHQLRPEDGEWGAALNSKISEMSAGDVLKVNPGDFSMTTAPDPITKEISIISPSGFGGYNPIKPRITRETDAPIVQTDSAVDIQVEGLRVLDDGVDYSSPAFYFEGHVYADRLAGSGLGGNVIELSQNSDSDNLNQSRITSAVGRGCGGSVIYIENTTNNLADINANYYDVRMSISNDGYAIEEVDDAVGNYYHVQHCEAGTHQGAILINGHNGLAKVQYAEIDGAPAIVFKNGGNRGIVGNKSSNDNFFQFDEPNNVGYQYSNNGTPTIQRPYGSYTIESLVEVEQISGTESELPINNGKLIGDRTVGDIGGVSAMLEGKEGATPDDAATFAIGPDGAPGLGDYGSRMFLTAYSLTSPYAAFGAGMQVTKGADARDRTLELYNSNASNKNYVWASVSSSGLIEFYDPSGNKTAELDTSGNLSLAGSVSENVTF